MALGQRSLAASVHADALSSSPATPGIAAVVPGPHCAANLPPRMISTNQFKNGAHIEVDGTVFRIVDFQHVKPGQGRRVRPHEAEAGR